MIHYSIGSNLITYPITQTTKASSSETHLPGREQPDEIVKYAITKYYT